MVILGLNAYHGDSSACIVVGGNLIAAVEKDRFGGSEELNTGRDFQ